MNLFDKKGVSRKEFITLYDQYNDAIYRYVFFRCYSKEVTQDLTADTFFKAWDYFSRNPNKRPDNMRAYLYRISSNVLADYFTKNNKEISWGDEEALDFVQNISTNAEEYEARYTIGEMGNVLKALLLLTPPQREIIVLRYIEDLSYSEISEIMNKSEGALRVLRNRAIESLKKKLNTGSEQ